MRSAVTTVYVVWHVSHALPLDGSLARHRDDNGEQDDVIEKVVPGSTAPYLNADHANSIVLERDSHSWLAMMG